MFGDGTDNRRAQTENKCPAKNQSSHLLAISMFCIYSSIPSRFRHLKMQFQRASSIALKLNTEQLMNKRITNDVILWILQTVKTFIIFLTFEKCWSFYSTGLNDAVLHCNSLQHSLLWLSELLPLNFIGWKTFLIGDELICILTWMSPYGQYSVHSIIYLNGMKNILLHW